MRFDYFSKAICVAAVMGISGPLVAAEFTVNDRGDAADADPTDLQCRTAAGACTLRAAVQQANKLPGLDTITVPAGRYELASDGEIKVTSNMRIVGEGADKTIISGVDRSKVFAIKNGASATISGVTVTQGKAASYGGAIGVWGQSRLALLDSVISDSSSEGDGAGLYVSVSTVSLENTTFSGNHANGGGGAIYVNGSKAFLTIHGGEVRNNSAINGGGIFCNSAGNVYLEGVAFRSNSSDGSTTIAGGGAIYNRTCAITLNRTSFDQNSATKRGGALFNASHGRYSITHSSFSNNRALNEDGGAIYSDGVLDMERVSLTGNSATFGSALYDAGRSNLSLVTVSDNSAVSADGSAIYHNSNSNLILANSTVAHNSGGNLSNTEGTQGKLQIRSSIIADAGAGGKNCVGVVSSAGYNLVSDDSCLLSGEGDISSADPLLLALQANGGDTLTREPAAGSPAIDAGPADCPLLDQRFHYRKDRCDIGAFEVGAPAANIGTIGFKQPPSMIRESAGTATITLTRSNGSEGTVSVRYYDDPRSIALSNIDFIDFDGVLEWADGESGDKSFQIQIRPDAKDERIEPLIIALDNPVGGVQLAAERKAILNIVDDDVQFGELAFDSASYTVAEGAGKLEVVVKRSNGDVGNVSVNYTTADKEATAGEDYTAVSGILNFADKETSKTIIIPVLDDSVKEPNESFTLQLSGITGGATEGAYSSATVTITDDDDSGSGGATPVDKPAGGGDDVGTTSASSSGGGGGAFNIFLLLIVVVGSRLMRPRCGNSA